MKAISFVSLFLSLMLVGCGHWGGESYSYNPNHSHRIPASAAKIESWKGGEEIKFVVRNDKGFFTTHGTIRLESWNDGDNTSEWVARRADGTLVTGGFKGRLEKFRVKKGENEQTRLVIRNSKGWFVTWASMDDQLVGGWTKWKIPGTRKYESRYVIRTKKGQFVNHAKGRLEDWGNFGHPVLVARDSYDDGNNGKILSWIAPKVDDNGDLIGYQNPDNGMRFLPFKNQ